ncbi:hypothetical protein KKF55_00610 [Patescibacteria group bacterium]|nr:hypothetical protein [Patescibacteria group bacterium]
MSPSLALSESDISEFFKPTIGKLVAPVLFLILVIYGDLFSPILGRATVFERLISSITNFTHIIFVIISLLIIYSASCLITYLISKFKK